MTNPDIREQINLVNAAMSRSKAVYGKMAQKREITYFVQLVLYVLNTEGPVTQKRVSDSYGIPKQTVNNVIADLKEKGYIVLEPGIKDRREKQIILTQKGQAYSTELLEPLFRIEENVIRRMGDELVQRLVDTATAYGELMEQEMERELKRESMRSNKNTGELT